MTTIRALVSKGNVQTMITVVLLFDVSYGFLVAKSISAEAIVGFAGLAINYFLPGKAETK